MTKASSQPVGLQLVDGVTAVPFPYEVWADGVYARTAAAVSSYPELQVPLPDGLSAGRKRLCFRRLWISGVGLTVDTDEPLVQLSYDDTTQQLKRVWLSRAQITDLQKLAALGALGLPIDSVSAEGVLIYLRAMEAANSSTFTCLKVGHRSGPYLVDGKLGWLIGKQWIGAGTLEADPRSNAKFTTAFSACGDPAPWYAKWREVRDTGWVPRFLMGATFAPPLLRLLKCRTFILHHWGASGVGKTAASVFALSAWGNAETLYSSLNRTSISITEVFKHLTDLPVLFDEKQVSTVASDELIYSICTSTGRERGAKDGGLRQDRQQWLTIARTTGEVPLITDSDLGGQFNRLLQIHSPAFKDRREAESIYPFVAENYGHAGPAFLRQLSALLQVQKTETSPSGLELLTQLCREMRAALVTRIGVDSNHAQYGAIIATAQMLAESWLLGIDVVEAKERALDDATLALQETAPRKQPSYGERALSKLRDHWVSNPGYYIDDTSDEGRERSSRVYKMIGIEMAHGMAFVPHEANELLVRAGFSPERVWRDFHTNEWLLTTGENPLTTLTLRNGKSPNHPVYCIRPEIFFTDLVRQVKLRVIEGGIRGLEAS